MTPRIPTWAFLLVIVAVALATAGAVYLAYEVQVVDVPTFDGSLW